MSMGKDFGLKGDKYIAALPKSDASNGLIPPSIFWGKAERKVWAALTGWNFPETKFGSSNSFYIS